MTMTMTPRKQYEVSVAEDKSATLCSAHMKQALEAVKKQTGDPDIDIAPVTGEPCDLCAIGSDIGFHVKILNVWDDKMRSE